MTTTATTTPARALASPTDTRLAKALSHPVRVQALRILNERVASPSDIARELDLPVANVSYHVSTLLRLQCIEEVELRPVRGAIEHLYRATRRVHVATGEWSEIPRNVRDEVTAQWLSATLEDLAAAVSAGDVERRDDRHLSFTKLALDEEAFSALAARLDEVLEHALELAAESAERLRDGERGGAPVSARLICAHYEREEPAAG